MLCCRLWGTAIQAGCYYSITGINPARAAWWDRVVAIYTVNYDLGVRACLSLRWIRRKKIMRPPTFLSVLSFGFGSGRYMCFFGCKIGEIWDSYDFRWPQRLSKLEFCVICDGYWGPSCSWTCNWSTKASELQDEMNATFNLEKHGCLWTLQESQTNPLTSNFLLYCWVLFFCEVNNNKNVKEYLCLGLLW